MTIEELPDVMTAEQVAAFLGESKRTIQNRLLNGEIPAIRWTSGSRYQVLKKDLLAAMEAHRVVGGQGS